jgi:hypothetical protein
MTLEQDCARVERDAMDLHAALAEAIRRLAQARKGWILGGGYLDFLNTDDLFEVLDRTCQPELARQQHAFNAARPETLHPIDIEARR